MQPTTLSRVSHPLRPTIQMCLGMSFQSLNARSSSGEGSWCVLFPGRNISSCWIRSCEVCGCSSSHLCCSFSTEKGKGSTRGKSTVLKSTISRAFSAVATSRPCSRLAVWFLSSLSLRQQPTKKYPIPGNDPVAQLDSPDEWRQPCHASHSWIANEVKNTHTRLPCGKRLPLGCNHMHSSDTSLS